MAVLKVLQFADKKDSLVLRKLSKEVSSKEILSGKIFSLVSDMLDTMYYHDGVGLAAPQIGVNKRVIVLDPAWAGDSKRNPLVLINPVIIEKEGEMPSEEGCLSFRNKDIKNNNKKEKKGISLKSIKRFKKIKVSYLDLKNKKREIEAEDNLLCRCLQHEIDHLDGIVLIDRCEDPVELESELLKNGFEKDSMEAKEI